jgi:ABC-2 type transport system permease protein
MQTIAHITPHAWANDAFAQLVANGASVTVILPQLGVLAAYAAVLLALATWRLRRVLTD